jgi:hypothetical protein
VYVGIKLPIEVVRDGKKGKVLNSRIASHNNNAITQDRPLRDGPSTIKAGFEASLQVIKTVEETQKSIIDILG